MTEVSKAKSKHDLAVEIFRKHAGKTRKEVISIIMTECSMSDAGASTYYYNAKKAVEAAAKTNAALGAITEESKNVKKTEAKPAKASKKTNETIVDAKPESAETTSESTETPELAPAEAAREEERKEFMADHEAFVAEIEKGESVPAFIKNGKK